MNTYQDAPFWDRIARKYARDSVADMAGYQTTVDRARELLGGADKVLELGCGTGTTALQLAPAAGSYLATDISSEMIAIAGEKLRETPVAGLEFRQATAETLAAEGQQHDVVLAFNLLHLVRDLPQTLDHVRDLTRPGGLFISKTACLSDMNPLVRLAIPVMRLIGKAPHVNIFSAQRLADTITDAGFDIIAFERHASKGKDTRPFILARRV